MKFLKTYNESLRDLMTPKSDDEILKSIKGLSNSDLLRKSIKFEFIKGIELALQNELTNMILNLLKKPYIL
jgi:tRNA U34 5-carboxymethylaminomethyl modifying enzyme MnmG/GidA